MSSLSNLPMKKGLVLITGATSGIGEATAMRCAKEKWGLVLVGRRKDRLIQVGLKAKKAGSPRVLTLVMDVRDRLSASLLYENHKAVLSQVDILVNNAGLARGLEKVYEGRVEEWEEMIDTNVKGLLYMTRLVLPEMVKRQKGHVVNIGSITGHQVYAGGAVYAATKFAVRALNDALRLELLGTGIRVTSIDPGMVKTEFSQVRFRGDVERGKQTYQDFAPLKPEDIAEAIWWSVSRPPHVNVQTMIIMPTDQASVSSLHRRPWVSR